MIIEEISQKVENEAIENKWKYSRKYSGLEDPLYIFQFALVAPVLKDLKHLQKWENNAKWKSIWKWLDIS